MGNNVTIPDRQSFETMEQVRLDATVQTMLQQGNVNFKDNVLTPGDLPMSGNTLDDFRLVISNGFVYRWNGSAWVQPSGGGGASGTPAQLLTKPKIAVDLGATQWNFADILSYISNGKAYADAPAIEPLPQLTIDGGGFLRWYTLMGQNNNGVTETFWVVGPEADISGPPLLPIDLGNMVQSGAFPIKSIGYVNFSGSTMTVGVDLFTSRNGADIFEFDYVTGDSEQGGDGQVEWDGNNLVMNGQYVYTMGSGYNTINNGTIVDITTLSGSIIPDGESAELGVFTDGSGLRLRPLYANTGKLVALVEMSNSTGSDWTFGVDALSLLSIVVSPLTPGTGGGPSVTPYNYIIDRANFMFIPEIGELYQTETARIYVDGDIESSPFVASVPSFTLNDPGDFVYLLGKYDGNRSRELGATNDAMGNFLNDGLPIILMVFRNNSGMPWSYGTQAGSGILVEIIPFYGNSNSGYNQVSNEVSDWYRLAEGNTSTNTQLAGTPVRLVRDGAVNRAKFLTSNTWMSPQTFGGDMMTPFDGDTKFFAQSQSTGSGSATYNLVSVDKSIGDFVFYAGGAFSNIEQVLRQVPLGGNKMAFGGLDNSGNGYVVIGTTDYTTGISFGTEVASNVDIGNQIAVKLDTDRFAIVWENGIDVVCATYDVTGTTFTIDAGPQIIISMTPTQIATLCKGTNFAGSIVQVAIDRFVMCPASDSISFVVDTSSGITSGSNAPVVSGAYNSVVRVDAISRLFWITNNGVETSWYIVGVSGTTLTYGGQTGNLTNDTIDYRVARSLSNGDSVNIVGILDNGDASCFRTISGIVDVSSFTTTGSVNTGQSFGVLQSSFLKVRNLYYLETDSVSEGFMFWGTQSSNPTQGLMMVFHAQALETYSYTSLEEYYITDYKFNDYVGVIRNALTVYSALVPITYVQVNALGSMLKAYSVSDNGSVVYISPNGRSLTSSDDNFVAGIQYSTDSTQNIYLTKDLENTVSRFVDTDAYLDTGTDTLTVPFWAKEADVLTVGDSTAPGTFDISTINGLVVGNTYKIYVDTGCVLNIILTPVGSSASGKIMSDSWRPSILVSEATNDYIVVEVLANGEIELVKYVSDGAIIDLDMPATINIPLSSAQILDLNSTPIDLLPTPGPGKAYEIYTIYGKLTYVSSTYATFTSLQVRYQGSLSSVFVSTNLLAETVTVTKLFNPNAGVVIDNVPLQLTVSGGNPTTGDGTLNIYLTYKIVDL